MAVTIRDVASAAGVSIATVSRALATPGQVAEATRERVQEAVRVLGYRPNPAARGLITGRTGNIGLVVPDIENPYFGSICKGVQSRVRAAGYAVFIADTDEDAVLETEVVGSLAKQVDGIILCSARGTDAALLDQAVPLVLVDRVVDGVPSVNCDNIGGVQAAMAHLSALGHRSVAYAGGPATSWSNRVRVAAMRAFSAGAPALDLIELGNFPPSYQGGLQAGDLAIASGATAVVAFNDLVAVGVVERLRQRGLTVPADMSVVGFDNVPVSTMVWPNLTTVDSPRVQMGRASVDMLLDLVLNRAGTVAPDIGAELIVRQSTGVAPG